VETNVDFLTVHFGSGGWTRKLAASIAQLRTHSMLVRGRFIVIDNSRDGSIFDLLEEFDWVQPVTYSIDLPNMECYGHDHPSSLKRGLNESSADILVVLDCDAHIVSQGFLAYLHEKFNIDGVDAITASDPRFESERLSHPCFFALNKVSRQFVLPIDPGFPGNKSQTARMTRLVLESHGCRVHVPNRRRAFDGVWGDFYDEQVYHHGAGTYSDSGDERMTTQAKLSQGEVFTKAVLNCGRYRLSLLEKVKIMIGNRLRKLSSQMRQFLF
jgi:hypothetical protein